MGIDVVILLLFAPVVCSLLWVGYRISRDERERERAEADAPGEPGPAVARTAPARPRPAVAPSPEVYALERRLRHELKLARAFSRDPTPESLWLD